MLLHKKSLFLLITVLLIACKKTTKPLYVTTTAIDPNTIQVTSVTCGGIITGEDVSSKGVCWSTNQNPTTNYNKTHDGTGESAYSTAVTGLNPQTTYYIRAYATNPAGTAYGDPISFATHASSVSQMADIDNNHYSTILIGSQQWMSENLKVTWYRNGDPIPNLTDQNMWLATNLGAYCNYNNQVSDINGALYNWYAVNDARKLATAGWHIPSQSEWEQLLTYLGGGNTAIFKMRALSYWPSSQTNTNESGFSAVPAGCRIDGNYVSLYQLAIFWTSTAAINPSSANYYGFDDTYLYASTYVTSNGLSIRCVKD